VALEQGFLASASLSLMSIILPILPTHSFSLARYGIMASPPNFKICPGMLSGPTDFFLPIADSRFLTMLILTVKGLPESVD
jgi:hypothetical protein